MVLSRSHTGTSWEDYYRYDSEASAEQAPRAVKTLIFQARGTATPGDAGKWILVRQPHHVINRVQNDGGNPTPSTGTLDITKYACPTGTTVVQKCKRCWRYGTKQAALLETGMQHSDMYTARRQTTQSPYPEVGPDSHRSGRNSKRRPFCLTASNRQIPRRRN